MKLLLLCDVTRLAMLLWVSVSVSKTEWRLLLHRHWHVYSDKWFETSAERVEDNSMSAWVWNIWHTMSERESAAAADGGGIKTSLCLCFCLFPLVSTVSLVSTVWLSACLLSKYKYPLVTTCWSRLSLSLSLSSTITTATKSDDAYRCCCCCDR